MRSAYSDIASQWFPSNRGGVGFSIFTIAILAVFISFGLVLSSINLPVKKRVIHADIPDRIAEYVKKVAKPVAKPSEVIKKPAQKITAPKKPINTQIKKQREPSKKPLSAADKSARKRVANKGILALKNELAILSDASDFKSMQVALNSKSIKEVPVKKEVSKNDILDSLGTRPAHTLTNPVDNASKIDVQSHMQARKLASLQDSTLSFKDESQTDQMTADSSESYGLKSGLDEESGFVFEKNKRMLYSVYERALRKNPGLSGKIVFELSINAEGKVVNVTVVSSTLNDDVFVRRLISRIKQFVFSAHGRSAVSKLRYPIEFLPG